MTTQVTLELPEHVVQQVQSLATNTRKSWEDVLLDWLTRAAIERPVQWLSDQEVLTLCDQQLEDLHQARLSTLLAAQRESELTEGNVD